MGGQGPMHSLHSVRTRRCLGWSSVSCPVLLKIMLNRSACKEANSCYGWGDCLIKLCMRKAPWELCTPVPIHTILFSHAATLFRAPRSNAAANTARDFLQVCFMNILL